MTPAQSRQISECLHYLRLAFPHDRLKTAQWLRFNGYAEAAIQAAQAQLEQSGG